MTMLFKYDTMRIQYRQHISKQNHDGKGINHPILSIVPFLVCFLKSYIRYNSGDCFPSLYNKTSIRKMRPSVAKSP